MITDHSYLKPLNLGEFDETDGSGTYIELHRLAQVHGRTLEEFLIFAKTSELRLSARVVDAEFKLNPDGSSEGDSALGWYIGPRGDIMIHIHEEHIDKLLKDKSVNVKGGDWAVCNSETDERRIYTTYPVKFVDVVKVRISQISCLAEDYSEFRNRLGTQKRGKARSQGAMQAAGGVELSHKGIPTAESISEGFKNKPTQEASEQYYEAPYIRELERRNDIYDCLVEHFIWFHQKWGEAPGEARLWNLLLKTPIESWGVEEVVARNSIGFAGKEIDRETFAKRYASYFVKRKASGK